MNDTIKRLETELEESVRRQRRELRETESALAAIQRLRGNSSPKAKARSKANTTPLTREQVLDYLRGQDTPRSTKEVAEGLAGGKASQERVSKMLSRLVREGAVQQTGYVPNVKGRRPMFEAAQSAEAVMAEAG